MASRTKRKVSSDRGKGKVSSSSMDSSQIFQDHTPQELARYQKHYQNKSIQVPKFGDLTTFPNECFSFHHTLISLGLGSFITSSGAYYPDLVKMFYCNMHVDNHCLVTHVRGTHIELSEETFGKILGIPITGRFLYNSEDEVWADYDKKEFYFSLSRIPEEEYHAKRIDSHGGEEPLKEFWSAGNFSIDDRLLHYVLAYIVLPRSSNHCSVTDMDMQVIYAIKHDINLNWSRLILHHMLTHTHKFKFFPYAWVITRIMKHFKVDFNGVEKTLMDTKSHKFSIKTVDKRMGVVYDAASKTVSYIRANNEEAEAGAQDGDDGEDIPLPFAPNGPSNQDLYAYMTTQFANLNTSINDQWSSANRQIALNHEATSNQLNLMRSDMNRQFSYLYSNLNIPPYDFNNEMDQP